MKAKIAGVVPGSIASELEIAGGDSLLAVNGVMPLDMIEYGFIAAEEYLDLEIEKADGRRQAYDIEKDEDEDLGIIFAEDTFDGQKRCRNKCIFCFVDQMPKQLRDTLYVKDDDYRLSFLYGNYITGTNLTPKDLERIKSMRISPLYLSVHAMDPDLRRRMLGNPQAGGIADLIRELAAAGIGMHTQVVLCPGINDGLQMDRTLTQLADFWPAVSTVAVVPVGLTRFQQQPELRGFDARSAAAVIQQVSHHQVRFQERLGSSFVFLADEFYLLAGAPFPEDDHYEGYPQIENGVGLARLLWQDFAAAEKSLPPSLAEPRRVTLVTGVSAQPILQPLVERFNQIHQLQAELLSLGNEFFGATVTVAGLLTGSDLVRGLHAWRQEQEEEKPLVLVPTVMLKFGEDVFLDGMTVGDVEAALRIRIVPVDPTAAALIDNVLGDERMDAE